MKSEEERYQSLEEKIIEGFANDVFVDELLSLKFQRYFNWLTQRERMVTELLIEGYSKAQIMEKLHLKDAAFRDIKYLAKRKLLKVLGLST